MMLKLVISGLVLFLAVTYASMAAWWLVRTLGAKIAANLRIRLRFEQMTDQHRALLVRACEILEKPLEERSIDEQLAANQLVLQHDRAAQWIGQQTMLIGSVAAFAILILEKVSPALFLIPIGLVGFVGAIASLVRVGRWAPGIRLGVVNVAIATVGLGLVMILGQWNLSSAPSLNYLHRWLFTPAGGFGGLILILWVGMQVIFFAQQYVPPPRQVSANLWMHTKRARALTGVWVASNRALIATAILALAWFRFDSIPANVLIGAYVCLGIWQALNGLIPQYNFSHLFGGSTVLFFTGLAIWLAANPAVLDPLRPAVAREKAPAEIYASLWPPMSRRALDGHLEAEDGSAIQIVAAGPDIALFKNREMRFPAEVVGVMNPWQRYYAFNKSDNAIEVGATPVTPVAERAWVNEAECYVMRTNDSARIERPVAIYATIENARQRKQPISKHYEGSMRQPELLPVVERVGSFIRLVRPDGAGWGFPLVWADVAGGEVSIEEYKD